MATDGTLILGIEDQTLEVFGPVHELELFPEEAVSLEIIADGSTLGLEHEIESLFLEANPQELEFTVISDTIELKTPEPFGVGEANEGANVGGGTEVFQQKIGGVLQFRTLVSGRGDIEYVQNLETIEIDVAGASFLADCLSTDSVGDGVYVSGPNVANRIQVEKVDITDSNKIPAIGIIESKITTTVCVVRHVGRLQVSGASFTPGRNVFFTNSGLSSTIPAGAGEYVQKAGQAIDTDEIFIQITPPIKRSDN